MEKKFIYSIIFDMKRIFVSILVILVQLHISTYAASLPFKKQVKEPPKISKEFENISKQATIFYAENDIKTSFDLLLSIPEEERSPQNWLLLGNILQDQGKNSEAIFMYQKAILCDENYYKSYYNLGNAYLSEDKPHLAIVQYKKLLNINPNFPYAYYNLGCAYIKIGELRKAKNAFISAIELKNTEPDFHYNLAYVYKKLKNEKNAKLYLKYYDKIMEQQLQ